MANGNNNINLKNPPLSGSDNNNKNRAAAAKRRKVSAGDKAFTICNTIFMILFVVITLYPVLNTLAISFNDGTDALRGGIYLIPRKFTLKNYITVMQKDNLITGAYITVLRTLIGTLLALVTNAILAYIVSRKEFIFRRALSLFWVITMYVNGGLIPTFLLYKNLHLTNTFWVYVIPGTISAFNMLVIRTYMNGISESLTEAAQIDGAGYTTIFLKVISPLCKPVYATIALFVAVYQWNSWFDAMLYNRMSDQYTTLQYELMKLLSSVTNQGTSAEAMKNAMGTVTPTSVRAAATIITMLPIICIYPFLQNYFVTGLTLGGVKE
ncbi:MAG: carbohydrate ABC transporter permease [Lachnospiraceae bacterium]|nr:carbohydrate ABC transporter permease [Lachnospiraceae bacterium]